MIVVDIGNTSISIAQVVGKNISKPFYLDSKKITKTVLKKALRKLPNGPVIVCSVVPGINKLFKDIGRKVFIVGKNIHAPIKSRYNKKQIGYDRLIAAYSARKLHAKTRIIIDFGTAITVDFISSKGVYEGGIILPGLGSTLRVLASCAMLPKKISLKSIRQPIPRDTSCSIAKGIEMGFSNMLNGLIADYRKKLKIKSPDTIVITGGEATFIRPKLNFRFRYVPNLVLSGLAMLNQTILTKK
jgi:type III pantothenate kinase